MLSVALTPHGDWVLSGSKDRGVQFWDPHTGVAQLMLQGHKNSGMLIPSRCVKSDTDFGQSSPLRLALQEVSSPRAAATCAHESGGSTGIPDLRVAHHVQPTAP